ncbi:MAG: GNAT family N-acetyltransferase [Actinobacteria bacterium]|nr:GNAT family N-acetyltransferase [Actinomycetota bacterium]
MAGVRVRDASIGDAEAIGAIHAHYAAASHATFETSAMPAPQREAWVRSAGRGGVTIRLVAEREGSVVGWAASAPVRPKPAYHRSAEVGVYVAPGETGRGVGRALLDALVERLRAAGAHRAYAVVALPNPPSERLFEAAGFIRCGLMTEAGWKFERWWDVAWWECRL